jgi:ketosteroid isomerase-like protein
MVTHSHAALVLLSVLLPRLTFASDADDVLATDAAWSAASAERGARASFEEFVADDAIVFRPDPVRAGDWLPTHEQSGGRQDWTPRAAVVDCSGRWAVTSGRWRYTPVDGVGGSSGQYVTVWRRSPEGTWRVIVDDGVDDGAGGPPSGEATPAIGPAWSAPAEGTCGSGEGAARLPEVEQALNDAIARDGLPAALTGVAGTDALGFRDEAAPARLAAPESSDGAYPAGSVARGLYLGASPESDLAYTAGVLTPPAAAAGAAPDGSSYLRIWRWDGRRWLLAIDVRAPLAGDPP